ncbi:hypothetical protein [Rubrobacter marinus]|uniref:hypothetical protein n=1 Tax=Rubrobacter marinus TaxID=2653852 RepID=UPI001A9ECB1B|nr:hypothetical protein [Rubrobacter marinus]
MSRLFDVAVGVGRALEERFDTLKTGVRRRLGLMAPPEVLTYRGTVPRRRCS